MQEFVPLALQLAELTHGLGPTIQFIRRVMDRGQAEVDLLRGDARLVVGDQARRLGLIDQAGLADKTRCGEFILVCEILMAVPDPPPPVLVEAPLVFTVPPEARGLLEPRERLDLLVEHLIRMARSELLIGGPFWNDPGFARLLQVLQPAVTERGVTCSFFVHSWPDETRRQFIIDRIASIGPLHRVKTLWYRGPAESLMHAKFVLRDGEEGYLGTANLTSHGLEQHVEVGLVMRNHQTQRLRRFLSILMNADLFSETPPITLR